MSASLTAEGWKEDQRLPKGWRIKVPVEHSSTDVPEKLLKFLNEEADELNAEEALKYLTLQNHSEEDILVFKTILADAKTKIKHAKEKVANSKIEMKPNVEKFSEEKFTTECVGEKEMKMSPENELEEVVATETLNEDTENEQEKETELETEEEVKMSPENELDEMVATETLNEDTENEQENEIELETEEELKETAKNIPACSVSKSLPEGWTIGSEKGAI